MSRISHSNFLQCLKNSRQVQFFKPVLRIHFILMGPYPDPDPEPEAEFKEFELRFKFNPRFKYGWFHLKLYQMFQDLNRRLI